MSTAPASDPFVLRRRPLQERLVDQGFQRLTVVLASLVGIVLLGILLTVATGAHEAIASFGLGFLTNSDWDPVGENYGAFTAIYGTIVTSFIAMLIADPLSFGIAVFLTELCPGPLRRPLGTAVELLAAVP
jgi:phosphate transport system permease protein